MKKISYPAIAAITCILITQISFSQNTWTQKADFGGTARYGGSGFSIAGKGYMGLGFDGSTYRDDFWEYNPTTDSWTQKANYPPGGRHSSTGYSISIAINNKGYVGTGLNQFGIWNDFWEFDPVANTWTQKANFAPGIRYAATGFSISDKGYLGLGTESSSGPFHNDIWEYDQSNDTWTQKANFGGAVRSGATGFAVGNKGYIGTGSNVTIGQYYNDFWEFDPGANSWTQKANLPATGRLGAVGFGMNGKGYIGLGVNFSVSQYYNDLWEFDPANNSWTQQANFGGTARWGSVGFAIGNKGYIGTGNSGPYKKDFWEYSSAIPGSSCATAIDLGQGDTCVNNITMIDSAMWFKFVADSSTFLSTIPSGNSNELKKLSLFSGACASSNQISIGESGIDTLPSVYFESLAPGNAYFLKVNKDANSPSASFQLCTYNLPTPHDVIIAPTSTLCDNICKNLITNGDFETIQNTPPACQPNCPAPTAVQYFLPAGQSNMRHACATFGTCGLPVNRTNEYTVASNCVVPYAPTTGCPTMCTDNTVTGNNHFFYGDAPSNDCPGCVALTPAWTEVAWQQNIATAPLTTYYFSMWYKKIGSFTTPGATLRVYINGVMQASVVANQCNWANLCITWPSVAASNALIQITCTGTGWYDGWDFGLDDISFGADQPPVVQFSFINELCMGDVFTFDATGSSLGIPYTYFWDFGDGITLSTGNIVQHAYPKPGQYLVTLTITNTFTGCCSKYSALVSVTPKQGAYNAGCCSANLPSSGSDAYIINPTPSLPNPYSFEITASGLNPGPFSMVGRIKDTVFIKSPAICTVSVAKQFGPWGKIIVEPGAILVLDIGADLRGLSPGSSTATTCRTMWQGIEVWGDASKNNASQAPAQGKLIMKNGSAVRFAHNAIVMGRLCGKGLVYNCSQAPPHPCYPYDLAYSGAILDIQSSATLQANANNVRFAPYPFPSVSKVAGCSFIGTTLPDPGYLLGNAYEYDPPVNTANIHYAKANSSQRTSRFAHVWGIRSFSSINTFQNNTLSNSEIGIELIDSKTNIIGTTGAGNRFEDMMRHISIRNTMPSPNFASFIKGNTFFNVSFQSSSGFVGPTRVSIYIENGAGDVIQENKFQRPAFSNPSSTNCDGSPAVQNNNLHGIYLRNSSANIFDNLFNKTYYGVSAINSKNGTISYLSAAMGGGGNAFLCTNTGILTTWNNLQTIIKCNTTNNQVQSNYFRNFNNIGSLGNQGQFSATDYTKPAGNQFDLTVTTGIPKREIKSNTKYIYSSHSGPVRYVPVIDGPHVLNPFSIPCSAGHVVCCTDPCGGNPSNCRTAQINNYDQELNALQQEFSNVLANLDKGQTTALLNAIGGSASGGNLKNLLIQNSPLSDEVLMAFINRNGTPPGHFKEVMIPNSPVSDNVNPTLETKLQSLPPGIAKQVRDAQASATVRTLTAISQEIASVTSKRQYEVNQLLSLFIQQDSVAEAIDLLEGENNLFSDQLLSSAYLSLNDIVNAGIKLSGMVATNPDEQSFVDLQGILLDLASQGKSVFEMNSIQEQAIRNIANMNSVSTAVSSAQNILYLVFGEQFSTAIDTLSPNVQRLYQGEITEENKGSTPLLFEPTPNPFSEYTFVTYNLPLEIARAIINVYDATGKKVRTYLLDQQSGTQKISLESLNNGIYLCGLEINGSIVETRKIILTQE